MGSDSISTAEHRRFAFAGFVLDRDRGSLQRDGADVKLRPKSYELLCYLLERQGRLVSKDDIIAAVWGDIAVTDGVVVQAILDIRRAIGDRSQTMIRTVPRRGYIVEVPVEQLDRSADTPKDDATQRPGWWLGLACAGLVVCAIAFWNLRSDSNDPSMVRPQVIAVLPFSDMSREQDLAYFADGIAEELINVLSGVRELRVIARTSSFAFREEDLGIASIRERLDVEYVLEGSVRQSGERIRITAQLIDAATDAHVWSESYDRTLSDVFAVQDEIARKVLTSLTTSLSVPVRQVRATDPRAYSFYLQGLQIVNQLDYSKNLEAQRLFEQSLAIDPNYAPAWRELARVVWRGIGAGPSVRQDIARNQQALRRAVELAPDDAGSLAYIAWNEADFQGDVVEAARLFEKAFAVEPAEENLIRVALIFLLAFGELEDAVALGEFGVARNPLCHPCQRQLVRAYLNANRLEDALLAARNVVSLFGMSQHVLGDVLLIQGRPQEALDAYESDRNHEPQLLEIYSAMALHDLGRTAEAERVFEALRDDMVGEQLWRFAAAYAWMGKNNEAIDTIHRAARKLQMRDGNQILRSNLPRISMIVRDPRFRKLHDDPRWELFLSEYGISANQLAKLDFEFALPQ